MNTKERILQFLKHLDIGQAAFEKKVGISNGYINNLKDSVGSKIILKISAAYPELDTLWLLTGHGQMLKGDGSQPQTEDTVSTGKLIPLFDAEAAAGSQYGMNMEPVSRPIGMIEIGSMLKDSELALRIYGNSMTPNYPAGCVVGLRPHFDSFIEPGAVYVVETTDNRYLKRLYYNKDKTAFRCLSDNHLMHESGAMKGELFHPEFEIPFEDLRKLFRVVGVIKRNLL